MANSDYDRPPPDGAVDSTAPPHGGTRGWGMPVGFVLALLVIGFLLFAFSGSREAASKDMILTPVVAPDSTGPVNPAPPPPSPALR